MNTGLDPEVLVVSGEYIVPAERFMPPPTRDENGVLNAMSFDNAAVEMRPEHSTDLAVLINRTYILYRRARLMMRAARLRKLLPRNSSFSLVPALKLRDEELELDSVKEFGCSPSMVLDEDFGAQEVSPLCSAEKTNIRSAGFHIHQELADPMSYQLAVGILDGVLGLTDVVVNYSQGWQENSRLRRLHLGYGKAGEFRVRPAMSGTNILEYRSLSPWPLGAPRHILWATTAMREVCRLSLDEMLDVLDAFPLRAKIVQAINECDVSTARGLLRDTLNVVPWQTKMVIDEVPTKL